jgi:hypothetical protein
MIPLFIKRIVNGLIITLLVVMSANAADSTQLWDVVVIPHGTTIPRVAQPRGGTWSFVDPMPTNATYNVQRFNPAYTIVITNVFGILQQGSANYRIARWNNYTNSMSADENLTALLCTSVATNKAVSIVVSNHQWIGVVCTGVVNGINSCVEFKW